MYFSSLALESRVQPLIEGKASSLRVAVRFVFAVLFLVPFIIIIIIIIFVVL